MTTTGPTEPTEPGDPAGSEGHAERLEERPELVGDARVTPIYVNRRLAYVLATLALLGLFWVLWKVPTVVTIAIGGTAFALLLSYPVRVLDRYMPRTVAVLAVLASFLLTVSAVLYVALPPIVAEVTEFAEDLPDIVTDAERRLREVARDLEAQGYLPADADEFIGDLEAEILDRATNSIEPILTGILGQVTTLLGLAITVFGILFVGITLLLDGDRLRRSVTNSFPTPYHDDLDQLWSELGASMSRYLGGLIVVAFVQGALVAVGLLLLDVPYALLLGLWVAMTSVIPYVGAWLGAVPAVILAGLFGAPIDILWVVLLYFAVNTVEGNFLTPRIQGDAVRVHPIIVLLTVIAVGSLFGILGVLLAVPMLAVARVFFDFLRVRVRLHGPGLP